MRYMLAAAALPVLLVIGPSATDPRAHGLNGLLAYQREAPAGDHTQTDIYTIRLNGTGETPLTNTPDLNEFGPQWNAAGTKLAFWRTPAPFGFGSIWTMNFDGTGQQQLTTGIDARDPDWNPAGTRLVVTIGGTTDFDLWTMRATDGGDQVHITTGTAQDFEPAWSPDGTRIAFTRGFDDGDPGNICVLTVATNAVVCRTNTPDYDHQVSWSPDGTKLVFERDLNTSSQIVVMNADGTHQTPLTSGPFFDTGPVFSPDGQIIAFGSDRGSFLGDMWRMTADGQQLQMIPTGPFAEGFPDWQALHVAPRR
jgi:Tol biopolymer transport system component